MVDVVRITDTFNLLPINYKRTACLGVIVIPANCQFYLQAWSHLKKNLKSFLNSCQYYLSFSLERIDVCCALKAIMQLCKRLNTSLTTSLAILEALLDTGWCGFSAESSFKVNWDTKLALNPRFWFITELMDNFRCHPCKQHR